MAVSKWMAIVKWMAAAKWMGVFQRSFVRTERDEKMKGKIVFATGNAGKMREIRRILEDLGMEILSMEEAGATPAICEDGKTFGENAEIKAMAVWKETGGIVLADDSGLVVDYLGGEPGIYSARYLGEDTSYDVKNQVIIDRLEGAKGQERAVLSP